MLEKVIKNVQNPLLPDVYRRKAQEKLDSFTGSLGLPRIELPRKIKPDLSDVIKGWITHRSGRRDGANTTASGGA